MKRVGVFLLCVMFALFAGLNVLAQEKKKKPSKELRGGARENERDLSELERSMKHLERSLRVLDDLEIPPLPEIPALAELPDFHIEIPEIYIPKIEIPEMHFEIPEIEIPPIEIPDLEWDGFYFEGELAHWNGEWGHSRFRDLAEEEELRIQALRSVARQDGGESLAMIEKVLKQDQSAGVRYHAVRLLRRHLDKDKVIDLLGETARNDQNAEVKKAAIRLLGKSGSPSAVDILQDIVRAK